MGKDLQKELINNIDNMKVGFLLELTFRQELISEQLKNLIVFFKDNEQFFNKIDSFNLTQGIDNFIDLFYSFTDIVFPDVDVNESYCKYYKGFY